MRIDAGMNILDRIVLTKQEEVSDLPPLGLNAGEVSRLRESVGSARGFRHALAHPRLGDVGLIAEIKKASPSAGIIRPNFDPVEIARAYERGGASCLSVLTDESYFKGSLEYLREVRSEVSLPLLRKDFLIDPRQVEQALTWGADAILLIVAILDDARLRELHALATEAGMDVLVEVHDREEMLRALDLGADLIGVNNRDLKTFTVNLDTTGRLAECIRQQGRNDILLVSESGIHTRADVERLRAVGAGAILVGESLMRSEDPGAPIPALVGGGVVEGLNGLDKPHE